MHRHLALLFLLLSCAGQEYIRQPAQVMGRLDPQIIREVLIEHIPEFRACYQKELDNSGKAFGAMTSLNFVVSPFGRVAKALVTPMSEDVPESVRTCVQHVLIGIKFPPPQGGGTVQIKQKINFYPKR